MVALLRIGFGIYERHLGGVPGRGKQCPNAIAGHEVDSDVGAQRGVGIDLFADHSVLTIGFGNYSA